MPGDPRVNTSKVEIVEKKRPKGQEIVEESVEFNEFKVETPAREVKFQLPDAPSMIEMMGSELVDTSQKKVEGMPFTVLEDDPQLNKAERLKILNQWNPEAIEIITKYHMRDMDHLRNPILQTNVIENDPIKRDPDDKRRGLVEPEYVNFDPNYAIMTAKPNDITLSVPEGMKSVSVNPQEPVAKNTLSQDPEMNPPTFRA